MKFLSIDTNVGVELPHSSLAPPEKREERERKKEERERNWGNHYLTASIKGIGLVIVFTNSKITLNHLFF